MTIEPQARFIVGLVDQAETDRRLAHDLCVWCAREMTPTMGDGMFCQQSCHNMWQRATWAKASGQPIPDDDEESLNISPQIGGRTVGSEWNMIEPGPAPGWMGGSRSDNRRPATIYRSPTDRIRLETDYGFSLVDGVPLDPGWDFDGRGPVSEVPPRPGIMVTEPHAINAGDPRHFAVGHRQIWGHSRIETISAEPEPELPFPVMSLRQLFTQGWQLGCNVKWAPSWWSPRYAIIGKCPRCEAEGEPTIITQKWPAGSPETRSAAIGEGLMFERMPDRLEPDQVVRTERIRFDLIQGSKVCCPECLLPYPGPYSGMVPLWRRNPVWDGVDLGVLHPTGRIVSHSITQEAMAYGTPPPQDGVQPMVSWAFRELWGEVYTRCAEEGTPWRCALPGCTTGATRWVQLTAQVQWQGHHWGPLDNDPVRVGLCHNHYMDLYHQCLTHDQYPFTPMDRVDGPRIRTTLIQ
jgi:hypothetical protein